MLLDETVLKTPQDFLSHEEKLLDRCDMDGGEEILFFWESSQYFVVLGRANKAEEEVFVDLCTSDGIPILQRCSGGGTVLQGPGCLNYALIVKNKSRFPNIGTTNKTIMSQQQEIFSEYEKSVKVEGITDLAINGIKFSGNAQRRKKNASLFHGTILYDFDLPLISKYLRQPTREPDYRENRQHKEFIMNVNLDKVMIKKMMCSYYLENVR